MRKTVLILAAFAAIICRAEPDDMATEAYAHFEATNEVEKARAQISASINAKSEQDRAYASSVASNALTSAKSYADSLVVDVDTDGIISNAVETAILTVDGRGYLLPSSTNGLAKASYVDEKVMEQIDLWKEELGTADYAQKSWVLSLDYTTLGKVQTYLSAMDYASKGHVSDKYVSKAQLNSADYASKTWVDSYISEHYRTPDFTTNNTTLVDTIVATSTDPGDYANVSNRAMNAVQTEADPVWNAEKSGYAKKADLGNKLDKENGVATGLVIKVGNMAFRFEAYTDTQGSLRVGTINPTTGNITWGSLYGLSASKETGAVATNTDIFRLGARLDEEDKKRLGISDIYRLIGKTSGGAECNIVWYGLRTSTPVGNVIGFTAGGVAKTVKSVNIAGTPIFPSVAVSVTDSYNVTYEFSGTAETLNLHEVATRGEISQEIHDAIQYAVVVDDRLAPVEGPGSEEVYAVVGAAATYLAGHLPAWTCNGTPQSAVLRNRGASEQYYHYDTSLFTDRIVLWVDGKENGEQGVFTRSIVFPKAGVYTLDIEYAAGYANYPNAMGQARFVVDAGTSGAQDVIGINDPTVVQHAQVQFAANAGAGGITIKGKTGLAGNACCIVIASARVTLVKEVGIEIGDIVAPDVSAQTGQAADAKATYEALRSITQLVSGEEMPKYPTQNELAEAVKMIFTRLGGTIQ